MIDIVTAENCDLKNVTQIGTPGTEGKIYIKDTPYARIHMDEFPERRVFVLMGHTEHGEGVYMTFVEEVIPVPDIAFEGDTPHWTNKVWNQVYQEIRERYAKLIVVGWALDIKGREPRITMELESIHREYFGGIHQIFFLLDTSEREEYFYINKNNHLYRKPGFYVYYSSEKKQIEERKDDFFDTGFWRQEGKRSGKPGENLLPDSTYGGEAQREARSFNVRGSRSRRERDVQEAGDYDEREGRIRRGREMQEARYFDGRGRAPYEREDYVRGRYREILLSRENEPEKTNSGGFPTAAAVFAAAVLFTAIAGTVISRDPEKMSKVEDIISAFSDKASGKEITFVTEGAEKEEQEEQEEQDTETGSESAYTPVEKVDGGIPPKNK